MKNKTKNKPKNKTKQTSLVCPEGQCFYHTKNQRPTWIMQSEEVNLGPSHWLKDFQEEYTRKTSGKKNNSPSSRGNPARIWIVSIKIPGGILWELCSLLLTLELAGSQSSHLGTHTQVPGQAAVTSEAARTPSSWSRCTSLASLHPWAKLGSGDRLSGNHWGAWSIQSSGVCGEGVLS